MNVISPGIASRMPATPRITVSGSPTAVPPTSCASSLRVCVTMDGSSWTAPRQPDPLARPSMAALAASSLAAAYPTLVALDPARRRARVLVPLVPARGTGGTGRQAALQLVEHRRGDVQLLVGVDDVAARRVQHQVATAVARHLLDRRPDLRHHFPGRALVLLHRLALGAPDVLDEPLVVADRALQRLLLLLALERRQDRRLVAHLGAQLIHGLLLLRRL